MSEAQGDDPAWVEARTFSENMRNERLKTGLGQKQFGLLVNMRQSEISKLESGGQVPSLATVARIAKAFGLRAYHLLQPID